MQRLRGILKTKDDETLRLMGAVSDFLVLQGPERKWSKLAERYCENIPDKSVNLFKQKGTHKQIVLKTIEKDSSFEKYGFVRNVLKPGSKSREVIPTSKATIRFLLRSLFGVGSRAECILYLLTHDGGHPSEVAKAIGISIRGTQDTLIELSKSGLILTRIRGKRKIEYWLSVARWWEFLAKGSFEEIRKPVWIDWIILFTALSNVWETLLEIKETTSEYMKSSKLREAMEIVGDEFAKTGIDIPSIPGKDIRPEDYAKAFEDFIIRVFGTQRESIGTGV
jgi:hypothetical protein